MRAPELDYTNLMGVWRRSEDLNNGFLDKSFSDIGFWCYAAFLTASLVVALCVYKYAKKLSNNHASYCRAGMVLAAVVYAYGAYMIMLLWVIPFAMIPKTMREGVFGDSFGTINALFSGLAFSGVLITLLFQRRDLSETRRQINDQNFESQFYSMLQHQQEVVRNFDIQRSRNRKVIAQGRDCFRYWDRFVGAQYLKFSRVTVILKPHCHAYNQIFWHYRSDLGLYFRSLYSVFRLIDNSKHSESAQFGLLVRSLLSDYELVLIFYNCLTDQGEKFTKYVYRFALFDNLDESLLLNQDHINYFTFEAYGSNRRLVEKLRNGPPSK